MIKRISLTVGFCLCVLFGSSQRILLKSAVKQIEAKYSVSFSYNSELVQGIKIDSLGRTTLSENIKAITTSSAFSIEKVDDRNFVLLPEEKERNIQIKGKLRNSDNQPLTTAFIFIEGQNLGTYTALDGTFNFNSKLIATDSVSFFLLGYESLNVSLNYLNETGSLDTVLAESSLKIDEVRIDSYLTNGFKYNHLDHSINLNVKDLSLLPGETETDVLTSLEALPGINSPDGKAGNLMIRGSDPDKTLITYDNIPIYHTGHYFGTISPFNTNFIDHIKIQKNGAQGADRGGRIGGSIEISSKSELADSISAEVGVGTAYYSASVNFPIVQNKISAIIGFRKSYPTSFSSIKIDSINSFVFQESDIEAAFLEGNPQQLEAFNYNFWDANAKVIYKINDKHKIEFSAINISNTLTLSVSNRFFNSIQNDTVKMDNWGGNVSYKYQHSQKFKSSLHITNSSYTEDLNEKTTWNNLQNRGFGYSNGNKDLSLKQKNEW